MNLIYVASPYAGDIERNTEFAKDACRFVMNEGYAFFAPHLLYPQVLNEHDSDDRRLGLDMGKEALAHCDELWVFSDTVSRGMQSEIDAARKLGIPIKYVAAQKMAERERPFAERHPFCSMRL